MPESGAHDASPNPAAENSHPAFPHGLTKTAWLEYFLLAALAALFVWRALIPAWASLNTDFPNYYLAARLYRQGYPLERVYDWVWFQRQWDHAGFDRRVVSYFPLTLFSALPILPLSSLPPLAAKRCWLVVNLGILGCAAYVLKRMTRLEWRRIFILIFLATFPLRTNFLFGQQHLLVFFLLTLAAWLYFTDRPASSGAALAAAAALKLYPALFVFYFLRKRQWRALAGLAVAGLALAGLSLLLFGYEAHRVYLMEVLPRSMRGETVNPYSVHWQSLTALFRRLFVAEPELNPYPLAHLPAAYAILQPVCQALLFVTFLWLMSPSRVEPARERLEYGSYIALMLALSPNPASYHFCALILAAVLATDYLLGRGLRAQAVLLACLFGLASLSHSRWTTDSPAGWANFLAFPRLYALLMFTISLAWLLSHRSSFARLKSHEAVVFGFIFLGMVFAGAVSNLHHLKEQFTNYAARVAVTPASLMAIQPAPHEGEIFFTALTGDGYRLRKVADDTLAKLDLDADTFHPTVPEKASEGRVELALARSRIVRFPLSEPLPPADQLAVDVEDGEQPVVSPDGRWLVFIREKKGRGSLWIKDLQPEEPAGRSVRERELVPEGYSVLEGTFSPDSRSVVFSAQHGSQPELFSVPVDGNSRVAVWPVSDWPATRYPAFSPDGAWLAFCWYRRGVWELSVSKVGSREVRQLTHGDCNSVTPAWLPDSRTIIYATDCGRGLGMTALAKITAVP